ncbi:MAG: DinB family protein [Saprospiraceae bacterium]|nr:DinB family protein [Saprospiraceae bacterium]
MEFNLDRSIEILERTPSVLHTWLSGLSDDWILPNEGPDTFSPFDVVGHLIHGDKTDWMVRIGILLSEEDPSTRTFAPFDRFAQFRESQGKTMDQLLDEFTSLRAHNLDRLRILPLSGHVLDASANHPALGRVTLRQLLATWTVHDLSHLAQIARVMARQYKSEVGPWMEYLPILTR